ncbi:MAG: zf-HC2 domain-containing protein [Abditibacteriota bacterium]|nr:zf-HC2 domain-containing protein [Abditibacteriota bacterium]
MNCDSIKNLLPDYKDGALSPKTEQAIKEHLEGCADCRLTLELLEKASAVLSSVKEEPAPSDLRSKVLGKIRKNNTSLFDVFFGIGHNPFKAGLAVGAALLLLAVVSVNVVNISGKNTRYETYRTADISGAYQSRFVIDK